MYLEITKEIVYIYITENKTTKKTRTYSQCLKLRPPGLILTSQYNHCSSSLCLNGVDMSFSIKISEYFIQKLL